jgi:hypothetical protein
MQRSSPPSSAVLPSKVKLTQRILFSLCILGGICRNIVEFLLERGHKVRAFVQKNNERSSQLQELGAETGGDLLGFMTIRPAFDGISGAFFVYPVVPGIVDATAAYFAQAAEEATVSMVGVMYLSTTTYIEHLCMYIIVFMGQMFS